MAAEPKPSQLSHQLLGSILEQLACPACFSSLELEEEGLICAGCGRVYPIVDGIPMLLAGEDHPNPGDPVKR